ncbi:sensor histidine kinase [Modestobacter roseus]|uniref:Oxygen sensor histidine kinase NreB n=1 Tax=Modestobacter roseus TaxID=1181884 RepID=A0A562ILP5_9ACTN|nr:sensor histidine kinase [Modestobacter roseus]MQA32151.1 sensor histidine kinase [Modestobacter roseus]TWH71645.1 signal transduction histidine kinase [Modestobacter roseus]
MTVVSRLRAAVLPDRGPDSGAPLSGRGWRITVVGFHVVFVVLLALAVVATQVGRVEGSPGWALAALAVLAVAYLFLGAPALAEEHPARAVGYLTVLVVVFGVLGWQAPQLLFLLFLAYPQIWFLVESPRPGAVWTALLAVASAVGPMTAWRRGEEPLSEVLDSGIGLVFSLALGLWVSRVLQQSRERGLLIEELEATRGELAAAHHQQGIAAERERWAREVHDTLAQGYTSIVVLAQTAAAQLPTDPGAAAERVALIEEVARDNLAEARAMVAAFAPVSLDSATLLEALQRLAERFGRETGIDTRVDLAALDEAGALTRAEEIVLLRGAQEALANVRRHAAATSVVLQVNRVGAGESGQVSVHVADDGVGFDPATAPGVGLAGLRDRAAEVGGAVDVVSAPGQGTRVTVRVPAS